MDGFIPVTGASGVAVVQYASAKAPAFGTPCVVTLAAVPAVGNTLVAMVASPDNTTHNNFSQGSWTEQAEAFAGSGDNGPVRIYTTVVAGTLSVTTSITGAGGVPGAIRAAIIEITGEYTVDDTATKNNTGSPTDTLTPTASVPAILLSAVNGDSVSFTPVAGMTEFAQVNATGNGQGTAFNHRVITSTSGSYAVGSTSGGSHNGLVAASFAGDVGSATWIAAPDTVDESDATSDDVTDTAIAATTGPFWRGDVGEVPDNIGQLRAVIGMEDAGSVTVLVEGGDAADWSDAAEVVQLVYDATGSYTADTLDIAWDATEYRYWRLSLDSTAQGVRVYEVLFTEAVVPPEPPVGKAILEIYVHDEDASRWGTATWATGPATGTEGIWSAAGWQDVTPQGVNAHIIWGSRRPARGILAEQGPASWNVETYDPERILDPGNFDGPYYPQLVAGVPIRISHDTLTIRTGIVDEWHYKLKRPDYQGQILASDTWSLLNQAMVPADSILGNTMWERIADAVNAAGVAVGGIPLPPFIPVDNPTIADWVEGAAEDDPTSVGEHVRIATSELHYVPFINADGGLWIRPWGEPLDRGREIGAPNLEDLEAVSHEDGLYSVVSVMPDPAGTPIIRKAAPMPRYGERVWERREPTVDPEAYAAAILAERPWPGVQWIPGAIHCFTHADVDNFGSIEIMERVTLSVPGAVSVQGRVLGGEMFVEHRARDTKGAKWIFYFAVATDGSTAIGSTILVADGTGENLVDDMTETDFLEAD